MKSLIGLLLTLIAVNGALPGKKKCTVGPSYWCANFMNAKECSATSHCLDKVWGNQKSKALEWSYEKDSTACTFCKDIVADVKKFLIDGETWEVIKEYLEKACGFMPDDYSRKTCDDIKDHYIDEFIAVVNKTVDPEQTCELVKLCQSDLSLPSVVHQQELEPALLKTAQVGDSGLCVDCKKMVAGAKAALENKDTQAEIKKLMEDGCNEIGQFASECTTLVDMMFDEMINAVISELTDNLCIELHVCDATQTSVDVPAFLRSVLLKIMKKSSLKRHLSEVVTGEKADTCTICEELINYVRLFVNNNATEQAVRNELETVVCESLGELSSTCKELIEQYFDEAWAEFISLLDAKTICTDLGLCSSVSKIPTPALPRARASVECVVCEFVMNKLEDILGSNATEKEIEDAVEKVCSLLPSTFSNECDQLVEKYGAAIIHLLVHEASPSIICSFLGLCGSSDSMYKRPLTKVGADYCMMCELAMSYVKSLLAGNDTREEIMHNLEKVCNFLSGEKAQECNTMIEQYGPMILDMLVHSLDGKQICTSIGLCNGKVDGLLHLYKKERAQNI